MKKYRKILKHLEEKHAPSLLSKYGLNCKQMQYREENASLYVAKSHWTNRFDPNREATIGIFFAVWMSPELIKQQQLAYNIHSKKLRHLPGYKLASRKFADEFRRAVKDRVESWPGIRVDYGPLTLLEGRDTVNLDNFSEKVEQRIDGFVDIHAEIDRLLNTSAR